MTSASETVSRAIAGATAAVPDPPALSPVVLATLVTSCLLALIFAYFWQVERRRHLALWTLAFMTGVLRRALEFATLETGLGSAGAALFDLLVIGGAILLLAGTYALYRRPTPVFWWLGGAAALVATVVARALELPFVVVHMPLFALAGVVMMVTGAVLIRAMRPAGLGRLLAGSSLVLWGIHSLNYPFLRDAVWFAPYGYAITAVLQVSTAVGFVTVHFERVRDALERSELRFRSIFDNSTEGLFRAHADGRFDEVNEALTELLGAREPDAVKAHLRADALLSQAARDPRASQPAFDPLAQPPVTFARPDGLVVRLAVTSWTVKKDDGEVQWIEGIVRDVTREHDRQARALQERKLEAIGQLAGGVAHDFNNLLTVILGCTHLLQRGVSDDERPELLAEIDEAANQAADLTRRLLTFSRQRAFEARLIDVGVQVAQLVPTLRQILGDRVELVIDLTDAPCLVEADPALIEQCLTVLVINARDAMPEGGAVTVRVDADEDDVVILVADDGLGIPAEVMPHLFEPFFTTKDVGAGTGLGLASVHGAITQLGGTIDAANDPGGGARFTIHLARRAAPIEGPPTASAPPSPKATGPGSRVLLVEDEPAVRALAARVLQRAGHTVVEATDGEDALRHFEDADAAFALVVTDIVMPRMSGTELAERLHQLRPELPVLFMSGHLEVAAALPEAERLRGGHVQKPFTAAALIEAVELVVASRVV